MTSAFERLAPELRGAIAAAAQSNRNAVALHLASKALYAAPPDNPAFLVRLAKAMEYLEANGHDSVQVSLESLHPVDAYDILYYDRQTATRIEAMMRKPPPDPTWLRVLPWRHPKPPRYSRWKLDDGFHVKRRRDKTWEWRTFRTAEAVVNMFRPISGRIQTLWIHGGFSEGSALYAGPVYRAPRFEPRNPLLFGRCDARERVRRCLAAMEGSVSAELAVCCRRGDGWDFCRVSPDGRGAFDLRWGFGEEDPVPGLSAAEVVERVRDPIRIILNAGENELWTLDYYPEDWTIRLDNLLS